VTGLRNALGEDDFDSVWAEDMSLSIEGRSPTPSAAGANANGPPAPGLRSRLPNATHLTHLYTKLGLTSRARPMQEATPHGAEKI
jgi:hypothetical protein